PVEELKRRLVCPMDIFEHHQDRLLSLKSEKLIHERFDGQLLLTLRRVGEGWIAAFKWDGEQGCNERSNLAHLGGPFGQEVFELVKLRRRAVIAREPRSALELVDDRIKSRVRVVGRALIAQP